jgi:hypothetical protein
MADTTTTSKLLAKVKRAVGMGESVTYFDDDLSGLITAAQSDMEVAGVDKSAFSDPDFLVQTAITTYCKLHFGQPDDAEWLKQSYDEQKAQLASNHKYNGGDKA